MNSPIEASDSTTERAIPRKRARMKRNWGERFRRAAAGISGSIRNCFGRRQCSQLAMIA